VGSTATGSRPIVDAPPGYDRLRRAAQTRSDGSMQSQGSVL
jgi:hypothetical protein